jgi:alkylhydroperoxidase family enzyme
MSRIPPDDNVQIPETVGASNSTMTGLFKVMAHRPGIMEQTAQLLDTAMRSGTVEPRLKELLAIRVSQVNHCAY